MRKNSLLVNAMALTLIFSGLMTGCAGISQNSTKSTDTKAAADTTAANKSSDNEKTDTVNISFLNSKGDIAKQLEAAAEVFNSTNKDGIVVTIETATDSVNLKTKYASGNPCTINPIWPSYYTEYADKAKDLSQEDWVKNVDAKVLKKCTYNGKLIAFPYTFEGDGLIYNKTTIEKAIGKSFDPATIKSLSDLEELYKKIEAGGVTPVEISSDSWSLGDHFIATAYETQSDPGAYAVTELQSGAAKIEDNATYKGLLDLLDLNKKYNIYKDSPMSSDYNTTDPENIATGKVAFWFNGSWTWANISQFLTGDHANDEFGFLPLFADERTTNNITVGVTNYLFIDTTKATKAQQEAAGKFLNWLVSDSAGQDQLVNKMGIIPAVNNITVQTDNDLNASIMGYLKAGNDLMFSDFPSDHGSVVGVLMQQYLAGVIDRDSLSKSINEYFTSQK